MFSYFIVITRIICADETCFEACHAERKRDGGQASMDRRALLFMAPFCQFFYFIPKTEAPQMGGEGPAAEDEASRGDSRMMARARRAGDPTLSTNLDNPFLRGRCRFAVEDEEEALERAEDTSIPGSVVNVTDMDSGEMCSSRLQKSIPTSNTFTRYLHQFQPPWAGIFCFNSHSRSNEWKTTMYLVDSDQDSSNTRAALVRQKLESFGIQTSTRTSHCGWYFGL